MVYAYCCLIVLEIGLQNVTIVISFMKVDLSE